MNIHKGFMTYKSHAPPRRSTGVPVNYHGTPGGKTDRHDFYENGEGKKKQRRNPYLKTTQILPTLKSRK